MQSDCADESHRCICIVLLWMARLSICSRLMVRIRCLIQRTSRLWRKCPMQIVCEVCIFLANFPVTMLTHHSAIPGILRTQTRRLLRQTQLQALEISTSSQRIRPRGSREAQPSILLPTLKTALQSFGTGRRFCCCRVYGSLGRWHRHHWRWPMFLDA